MRISWVIRVVSAEEIERDVEWVRLYWWWCGVGWAGRTKYNLFNMGWFGFREMHDEDDEHEPSFLLRINTQKWHCFCFLLAFQKHSTVSNFWFYALLLSNSFYFLVQFCWCHFLTCCNSYLLPTNLFLHYYAFMFFLVFSFLVFLVFMIIIVFFFFFWKKGQFWL